MILGLIADTHGLLRPQVFEAFAGVDRILHAGDVGDPDILLELGAIAPVTAVWGNVDGMELREILPEMATPELEGVRVTLVHGHQYGSPTPRILAKRHPGSQLVVYGHSHRPEIEQVGSVLAVNPGSAGAARFRLPVTVALATLSEGVPPSARLVHLIEDRRSSRPPR